MENVWLPEGLEEVDAPPCGGRAVVVGSERGDGEGKSLFL